MVNKVTPIRTCAGTGTKTTPENLVRFTRQHGVPTPDVPGQKKAPGRGCYILPTEEAYTLAIKKRAFGRHLQSNKPPLPWGDIAQMLALIPKKTS